MEHVDWRQDTPLRAFDFLEWELLCKPLELTNLQPGHKLPPGTDSVTVSRDAEYKLRASYSGVPEGPPEYEPANADVQWKPAETFDVVDSLGTTTTLKQCIVVSENQQTRHLSDRARMTLRGNLHISSVHQKASSEKPAWLTEWFLNGPTGDFHWPRNTDRKYGRPYKRERLGVAGGDLDKDGGLSGSLGMDWMLGKYHGRRFAVTQVPNGLGPEWGRCTGIEFRAEWGGIPDEKERQRVGEFLSFIFGRQMLPIGWSAFTEDGLIVERVATNPWGSQVQATCRNTSAPPKAMRKDLTTGPALEALVGRLLSKYLELRDDLQLDALLWHVWVANGMPLGPDAAVFYSGLNGQVTTWLKSTKTKVSGVYIPKAEFDEKMKNVMPSIKAALNGAAYADRMTRRIEKVFNKGGNEQFQEAFADMGVPLGPYEESVFQRRNGWAHGGAKMDEMDVERCWLDRQAYLSTSNRMMLAILGDDGSYLDLTKPSIVEVPLATPISEPSVEA